MPAKELSPGRGLDCKAQLCIRRKVGNDEEHLVVVWLQTEAMGEVKAMAIARIERRPEGLGVRDESWVLSDVVQNGLTTGKHPKEKRAKLEHRFVRVLRDPRGIFTMVNVFGALFFLVASGTVVVCKNNTRVLGRSEPEQGKH